MLICSEAGAENSCDLVGSRLPRRRKAARLVMLLSGLEWGKAGTSSFNAGDGMLQVTGHPGFIGSTMMAGRTAGAWGGGT